MVGNGLVLIQGAADGKPRFVQDVRVNHGGGEVAMAEELLDRADVVSALEKVGGPRKSFAHAVGVG